MDFTNNDILKCRISLFLKLDRLPDNEVLTRLTVEKEVDYMKLKNFLIVVDDIGKIKENFIMIYSD